MKFLRTSSAFVLLSALAAVSLPSSVRGEEASATSVDDLARASLSRGLAWLRDNQKEDGSWSQPAFPGLSALCLWAAAKSGDPAMAGAVEKGAAFVAGFAQEDGGIYRPAQPGRRGSGGLSTYNTAICMMALHQVDPVKYAPIILKAREYVASSQLVGDSGGEGAVAAGSGGFGYNRPLSPEERARRAEMMRQMGGGAGGPPAGRGAGGPPMDRADLSNTGWALMAMRTTEGVEDLRPAGEAHVDIQWDKALAFVESMQNRNPEDPDADGSFGYERGGERDGRAEGPGGKVALRGFGSMTYDGLESMIYANVGRDDPRVRSAVAWAARHWTVDENPGSGQRGLYYYYTIVGKSLSLFTKGAEFKGADGKVVDWRGDLVRRLAATQRGDGSWANDDNSFWEGDPALVTAYSLLALESVLDAAPAP